MIFDFAGCHAVVTGAGGGMGEEIACRYLEAGGSVTAFDLKPCSERLLAFGERLTFYQGDIADAAFVKAAVAEAAAQRGRLDHLANVAGVLWFERDASALDMDLAVWDQVMDINLKSMVHMVRAAVPAMRATEGARAMVHFSTTQWYRGDLKPQDAYQASKAAVCAFSKSMAMQLAREGIRSNAVCPGPTLSSLQARWDSEEKRAAAAEYIPMGRLGAPRDMANACLFLFSEASSFITGIELIVDGGLLMRV
ncbi:MAG: SDR family oxidoreductase [Pseudomonadota bacterium]